MREPGESESLGSGGEMDGLPLQSSRGRQGTESAEAEAERNDCPLPAFLKSASCLQGNLGAQTQVLAEGRGCLHHRPWRLK